MLSEPYGSHYIRWRYQTTSRRRRTIIFSHSFFRAASHNSETCRESPDDRPLVVLFVHARPPSAVTTSRPPASEVHGSDPPLVALHASSDLSRPGAAAAVQPPCTAWQA